MEVTLRIKGLLTLTVLLATAGLNVNAVAARPNARSLNAADFDAAPDDGKDDGPAIQAMLAEARKTDGPVTIRFAPKRYDFFAKTASKASYPVAAVHQQWDLVTPFHLDAMKHVTIDGGGATFVMHGRMTPFVLAACEGITVRNVTIEQARPSVFELVVVGKGDDWIDYKPAAGDHYRIEGKELVWLDGGDKPQRPNCFQDYNPLKDTTLRRSNPLAGTVKITKTSTHRLRVQYAPNAKALQRVQVGHTWQFRDGLRNQSGAVIFECRDVTFEDMAVHSWNGLGFIGQFSTNVTLRNLRMEPAAKSGRTNAGFADAVQMMNCRGRVLIEGCRMVGLHDDHINIYGQLMQVQTVESPKRFRAIYTCKEMQGHRNFHVGDLIGFHNAATLADAGQAKVVKAELLDKTTMRIEIDKPLPTSAKGMWAANRTWIPDEVVIRNNYFGRVPTRSILMYLARKAVIEHNVFHRIPMPAILLKTPDQHWALQNYSQDLTIRDNVFFECRSDLVRCRPQVKTLSPKANLYGRLRFTDNLIVRREGNLSLVNVRGFEKVRIGPNRIELGPDSGAVEASIADCPRADLATQQILSPVGASAKLRCERVTNVTGEGWQRD